MKAVIDSRGPFVFTGRQALDDHAAFIRQSPVDPKRERDYARALLRAQAEIARPRPVVPRVTRIRFMIGALS